MDTTATVEPPDSTPVGDYHTHGDYSIRGANEDVIRTSDPKRDDFNSDHFDSYDKDKIGKTAKKFPGWIGYLGTPSGNFRAYDPVTKKERDLQ